MSDNKTSKYDLVKGAIGSAISEITSWAVMFAGLALALLILSAVSAAAGYPIRFVPALDHVKLAYLAGSLWLLGRR